ncbi:MAG: molybdate ABC transporter substrate-binding protein [Deltaproteobacteria bacterium]|nr:MAG: molybdate ABC transporter substrate-binding protein [Deltaproteobacteria bacterium]
MKKRIVAVIAVLLNVLLLPAALGGEIRIFAAASLKEVLAELAGAYGKDHPETRILPNYGASGTLARQIDRGAPADIFLSAGPEWMDFLVERKRIEPASAAIFAYNTLVFCGPDAGATKPGRMEDLPAFGRIAIGSPKSVPAGAYAAEAMKNAGVAAGMERKLVVARDVREALAYAERGEVDGAFVYRTDLPPGRGASILFVVPRSLHSRVTYPMARTAEGAGSPEAAAFFRFLGSAEAKRFLERRGFNIR